MSHGGRLDGRRIVVTAGASGLGLAMAERFDAEGARVAVCDADADAVAVLKGRRPGWLTAVVDVRDEAAAASFFETLDAAWAGVDGLVNNAGIAGPTAPVQSIALDDWRRTFDVNVLGTFVFTQLAVRRFVMGGGGAIVNMSSSAGRLPFPFRSPYAAAKWAIVGLTKTLAAELGPAGIRVNAILPGLVEGSRLDAVIDARAREFGRSTDEQRRLMLEKVSMREPVRSDDVAAMAAFLLSDDARRVTGEALAVDGGLQTLV